MESPQAPEQPVPGGPQAPAAPEAPPGGWHQPIAQQAPGWVGRPLASWGIRLGAWFIDLLIIGIPAGIIALGLLLGLIGAGDGDGTSFWALLGVAALSTLAFALIALVYAPATMAREGAHNGQTWGKQLLGIRVVRDGGEPETFWQAALREVVFKGLVVGITSSILPFIPWFLNYFWPLWDDENRALHDIACSTHVIET